MLRTALLAAGFGAILPAATVAAAAAAASMNPAVLAYANPDSALGYHHYGPGTINFTSESMDMGWTVSTSDPARTINYIGIPMDLRGLDGVYFQVDKVHLSGWLELAAGSYVQAVDVDVRSDLPNGGIQGSGAQVEVGSVSLAVAEGFDKAGYTGAFSASADFAHDAVELQSEESQRCGASVQVYRLQVSVAMTIEPYRSKTVLGKITYSDAAPLRLTLEGRWQNCG